MQETNTRSLLKSLTWRVLIFISDFAIAYWLTKRFDFAGTFAIIKFFLGFILYFFHERGWNQVSWGKFPKKQD